MKQLSKKWGVLTAALSLLVLVLVPLARSLERAGSAVMKNLHIPPLAVYITAGIVGALGALSYTRSLACCFSWRNSLLYTGMLLLLICGVLLHTVAPIEATHLILYGSLGCSARMFLKHSSHSRSTQVIVAFAFSTFVGISDEFLQWLHPQRVFDVRDIAINAASAIIGLLATEPFYEKSFHNFDGTPKSRRSS